MRGARLITSRAARARPARWLSSSYGPIRWQGEGRFSLASRARRSAAGACELIDEQPPRCVADPGPSQSAAVPDQRCTTSARAARGLTSTIFVRSRCTASGTRPLIACAHGNSGPGPRFPHTDERVPGPRTAARHDTHTSCRPLATASHFSAHPLGKLQPKRDMSYCCFSQALSAADETPPVITQGSPR
jgi:hypothetical protein